MRPSELAHGLHLAYPEAQYHQAELAVASNSGLKEFDRSPLHFRAWVEGAGREETDVLRLGRAVHLAQLEPARYALEYCVMPYLGDEKDGARTGYRTNAAKARKAEWMAEHGGGPTLTEEEVTQIRGMVEAILRHPEARTLMQGGESEVTCRWRDPGSGVECKGRIDHWLPSLAIASDLKSTDDASADGFLRSVTKYDYHHQDDFYQRGLAALGHAPRFAFVAVEKKRPHGVMVHEIDQAGLQLAHDTNSRRLERMAECLAANEWPGLPTGISTLSLPHWKTR